MKPINLCVTTFNRQDLLGECLRSAFAGTVKPDSVCIIDQVNRPDLIADALKQVPIDTWVIDLGDKRGCEGSAINWYLQNISEERIIAHEDVVFGPTSLEQFVNTPGDFLIESNLGVITYRNPCIEKIGLYDITISPNYFRYVDVDYEDRLALVGIHPTVVDCGIWHLQNGTLKGYTDATVGDYLQRQHLAAVNYEKKWGRPATPGGNTIGRGEWRRQNQNELESWRSKI